MSELGSSIPTPYDIIVIARMARKMLRGALDAYVERDEKKAADIIAMDNKVDEMYLKIKSYLVRLMTLDNENIPQLVEMLQVCKYVERIADHAQNVAEWVVYYIEGRLKDEPVS